jgi:hypothetical protein
VTGAIPAACSALVPHNTNARPVPKAYTCTAQPAIPTHARAQPMPWTMTVVCVSCVSGGVRCVLIHIIVRCVPVGFICMMAGAICSVRQIPSRIWIWFIKDIGVGRVRLSGLIVLSVRVVRVRDVLPGTIL